MRLQQTALQQSLHLLWMGILLLSALLMTKPLSAHESKPAVAVLQFTEGGEINIELTSNIEAIIAGLGPEHNPAEFAKAARYAALRKMSPEDLQQQFKDFSEKFLAGIQLLADDAPLTLSVTGSTIPEGSSDKTRESVIQLKTTLPDSAKTLSWQWAKDFGVIALRLHSPEQEDVYNAYLEPAVKSEVFALDKLIPQRSKATVTRGQYLGAKSTEYPNWFKDSFLEFKDDVAEAAEQGKRLAIIFHQDNCPYCNLLVERNLSQHDIQQQMKDKLEVISINMWGARELVSVSGKTYTERDFAAALKVQYTPTILFFNESGKLALRLNGYLQPAEFKRALDFVTGKHETTQSYAAYVAANRVESASAELNKQAFFAAAPYDLSLPEAGYDKPLAVYFEQTSCPNCDALHKDVLTEADTKTIIEQFQNIQLDMWSDTAITTPQGEQTTAKKWAEKLGINYAPSIVLFDKQGQEVIRIEAMFKAFHTQSTFDYVLSEAYKTEPGFQRYITHRADEIRETGKDVDLWK